ncbi:hypothetical protein EXIGLDRAFT_736047 [Exidia glandulosa HHB12029]|uniref:Uncharacterized protein n=1 Tax=Exidia glandulosa HHB12029 TaxID=1314781 RepID=A0A166NBK7_EXIGL|nr:hypothetical protein EXIGLDRAFT_736047 [Exidia glandulosa HHB12029]
MGAPFLSPIHHGHDAKGTRSHETSRPRPSWLAKGLVCILLFVLVRQGFVTIKPMWYRHAAAGFFAWNPSAAIRHELSDLHVGDTSSDHAWCFLNQTTQGARHSASYSAHYVRSSPKLYFLNRGRLVSGNMTFAVARSEDVDVPNVGASFTVRSKRDDCTANVCLLQTPDKTQIRLGVYDYYSDEVNRAACEGHGDLPVEISASIVFVVPTTLREAARWEELLTQMGSMSVHLSNMTGTVELDAAFLQSDAGHIVIDGLRTSTANFRSRAGGIYANIAADDTILLASQGGPIRANATLRFAEGADAPSLYLSSSQGTVDVAVALELHHPRSDEPTEFFLQSWIGAGGDLRTNVSSMPSVSEASLGIININNGGRAEIVLPAQFEGSFSLISTQGGSPGMVRNRPTTVDPEGRGRNRTLAVVYDEENGMVAGETFWGHRPPRSDLKSYVYSETRSNGGETILQL